MSPFVTGVLLNSAPSPHNKCGGFFRALRVPVTDAQKGCGEFTLDMVTPLCLVGTQ